jgi:hypothetical protein
MIDKLNERLFKLYNGKVPERLNDAVFGIVANGGVARVYATYACLIYLFSPSIPR